MKHFFMENLILNIFYSTIFFGEGETLSQNLIWGHLNSPHHFPVTKWGSEFFSMLFVGPYLITPILFKFHCFQITISPGCHVAKLGCAGIIWWKSLSSLRPWELKLTFIYKFLTLNLKLKDEAWNVRSEFWKYCNEFTYSEGLRSTNQIDEKNKVNNYVLIRDQRGGLKISLF